MTSTAGLGDGIGHCSRAATPTGLGRRDAPASRTLRNAQPAARARIRARDARRKGVDVLARHRGGRFGEAHPAWRPAQASGGVVRCRRFESPNRGPPKATKPVGRKARNAAFHGGSTEQERLERSTPRDAELGFRCARGIGRLCVQVKPSSKWAVDVVAIDRARILRGWTRRDLGREAHVDEDTLSDLFAGRRTPTFGTLRAVYRALDLPLGVAISCQVSDTEPAVQNADA